jgi:hypothetical protein
LGDLDSSKGRWNGCWLRLDFLETGGNEKMVMLKSPLQRPNGSIFILDSEIVFILAVFLQELMKLGLVLFVKRGSYK